MARQGRENACDVDAHAMVGFRHKRGKTRRTASHSRRRDILARRIFLFFPFFRLCGVVRMGTLRGRATKLSVEAELLLWL